jgi:hypothetical protein
MTRWGLIPSWSNDVRIGYKMINARSETVADKLAFGEPFRPAWLLFLEAVLGASHENHRR